MPEITQPIAEGETNSKSSVSVRAVLAKRAHRYLRHPVARNALAMYGIQIAGYVLPLLTLPYLARMLHPSAFGLLLFFQSFALWSSMVIEYGFNLSATREVARSKSKPEPLAEIGAGVLGAKIALSFVFVAVAGMLGAIQPNVRQHPAYLVCAVPMTLAFGLSPFWYFQGTERMVGAVVIEFASRALATLGIFLWVRTPDDAWKALALYAVAGSLSTIVQTIWMYQEIRFHIPCFRGSVAALKRGLGMFLFRGAYNIYTTANAFILGLFVPPMQVGFYGGAERIAKAFQGLSLPIAQSLYPHMTQLASDNLVKAARLAQIALRVAAGIGLVCAVVLAGLARWGVQLILGPGYEAATPALYVFAILMPVNSINSALIMQWMLPLGMERTVGAVTMGAILLNVAAASLLAPRYAPVGMAFSILLAETLKLTALIATLLWSRSTPLAILRNPTPAH